MNAITSVRENTYAWWQTATGYQIYPLSFCDSNGDGYGDIPGIVSRLDHLADLGIGFIWLSPVYRSPMVDNGYDISDYRDIAPVFGTLSDFDNLVAEARKRGIGIVMDLVVNHSSDQHRWFQKACLDIHAPEHDFYIWRDPKPDGGPPSDLKAAFGGPAWHFVPEIGQYYLGYFSAAQPDLNWQNPALRAEIYDMMNWWFDRGIAGFRMDVIDLIGKDVDAGIFESGPYLHGFLKEMHEKTLAGRDVVTVGETWSATRENALLFCGRDRQELSMVFQFNHVIADHDTVHGKWKPRPFDLVQFKSIFSEWQDILADDGWNALFLSNHDLPRQVSKYGDDGIFRVQSAKMLATVMHLMKGTPFIYQGEEIGMTNCRFTDVDQFRDVETLGHYKAEIAAGVSQEDFFRGVSANGRENARTPMQWDNLPQAGFTSGKPWIDVNPNYREINVAADRKNPDGIYSYYRKLIALRHRYPVVTDGRYVPLAQDDRSVFAYRRENDARMLTVVANFTGETVRFALPQDSRPGGEILLNNYPAPPALYGAIALRPYEVIVSVSDKA
ncbi:alpha-glucosidase [uncultured Martelella sp.]|uniref:alpha-glucosidase n=1 Tax=uncultured Martelella sp. TaxID=392331 RepID=UPI0029C93884|nr:alpha-glucosidase [uncultured Martelella sp.]